MSKHLHLDIDSQDLSDIFKMFRMESFANNLGEKKRVANVLELFTALILLAEFGESSPINLQYNAELIEHKINLLLLLFDLRNETSINISEVIIMLKTSILSL